GGGGGGEGGGGGGGGGLRRVDRRGQRRVRHHAELVQRRVRGGLRHVERGPRARHRHVDRRAIVNRHQFRTADVVALHCLQRRLERSAAAAPAVGKDHVGVVVVAGRRHIARRVVCGGTGEPHVQRRGAGRAASAARVDGGRSFLLAACRRSAGSRRVRAGPVARRPGRRLAPPRPAPPARAPGPPS